jgi:hypothetical protein
MFTVSNGEPPHDGETNQERVAREERNAGGQRDIRRNLTDAFDMCDNQQVFKTPSANITVATNELNRLPESSALDAVKAYLKAATV